MELQSDSGKLRCITALSSTRKKLIKPLAKLVRKDKAMVLWQRPLVCQNYKKLT